MVNRWIGRTFEKNKMTSIQNARVVEIYVDDDNSEYEQEDAYRLATRREYIRRRVEDRNNRVARRLMERTVHHGETDMSHDSDTDELDWELVN